MKSLSLIVEILQNLHEDLSFAHPSLRRDFQTLIRRFTSEGFTFQRVLDEFLSKFLVWIECRCESEFPAIPGIKTRGGYPLIFGDVLRIIRARHLDGNICEATDLVFAINQTLSIFSKVPGVSLEKNESDFAELCIRDSHLRSLPYDQLDVMRAAQSISRSIVNDIDFLAFSKHENTCSGPGACYEGLETWERWDKEICPAPLFDSYLHPLADIFTNRSKDFKRSSRFTTVEKTSFKRRSICIEPAYLMFHQKYVQESVYDLICRKHPMINVRDQSRNQSMALDSSRHRRYATLDLKSASDRVSLDLVKYLFRDTLFLEHLLDSRSTHVEHDCHSYELKMFATMGNATTFPVQTIVFYSLVEGIRYAKKHNGFNFARASVYGDDIIIDARLHRDVLALFDFLGFVINPSKSFKEGYFRESCGMEAFYGTPITPFKFRASGQETTLGKLVKYHDYINLLYKLGLWNVMNFFVHELERCRLLQYGTASSPFPCVHVEYEDALYLNKRKRYSRTLHRHEVYVRSVKTKKFSSDLPNARLLAALLGKHASVGPSVSKRGFTSIKGGYHPL